MAEPTVVALDLGGTDLKVARIARGGDVRGFRRVPSRASEGEGPLMFAVRDACGAFAPAGGGRLIGFGCPGMIDPLTGAIVGTTPHLSLPPDFPMRERLADALFCDVIIDNDANCAALGEHVAGAAAGASVSITVTIGTGVGCGIIVDGRVYRGAHGGAGEIGHLPLGSDGPACSCGVAGCAEPHAGGGGLLARAKEAGLSATTVKDVFESGHPKAPWLLERMTDRLGQMLGAAVQILDPDVIVVGGGVSGAGEKLLSPLRRAIERCTLASHRRRLRIEPAKLGEQAGVVGAGLLAWAAAEEGTRRGGPLSPRS